MGRIRIGPGLSKHKPDWIRPVKLNMGFKWAGPTQPCLFYQFITIKLSFIIIKLKDINNAIDIVIYDI